MTKRVFVTGGAKGIGAAIVSAFTSQGNEVAFCDIDAKSGEETAKVTGAEFVKADAGNKIQLQHCVQNLLKKWGDIDIIINNVGVIDFKPLEELSVEEFDQILQINLRSAFITSRELAIHRKSQKSKNKYGRIINICSTRYLMSEEGTEAYSASKGGIYSLTHALSLSLAKYHITVNSISPGWIENEKYDKLTKQDHSQHPSGRVGKPEDIARMCVFICEESNDFINGENILIDGGMTKKMIYV